MYKPRPTDPLLVKTRPLHSVQAGTELSARTGLQSLFPGSERLLVVVPSKAERTGVESLQPAEFTYLAKASASAASDFSWVGSSQNWFLEGWGFFVLASLIFCPPIKYLHSKTMNFVVRSAPPHFSAGHLTPFHHPPSPNQHRAAARTPGSLHKLGL